MTDSITLVFVNALQQLMVLNIETITSDTNVHDEKPSLRLDLINGILDGFQLCLELRLILGAFEEGLGRLLC